MKGTKGRVDIQACFLIPLYASSGVSAMHLTGKGGLFVEVHVDGLLSGGS